MSRPRAPHELVREPEDDPLSARRALGMRLGLPVVRAVYEALGRPGVGIPTVHVVGTNGKGSTAALLEHALRGRGRRPGVYTSPHLHRLGERVRIDGRPIDDAALREGLQAVLRVEQGLSLPRPLSFFELLTLAALQRLAAAAVDVMIVEAGLGARRDATRVITASAVAITSIGLDHQASIGPTLVEIAREKAGAMAPGVPAFTALQAPDVLAVLRDEAQAVGCALHEVPPRPRAPAGLLGEHQRGNAGLARAVGRTLVPDLDDADLDGVVVPGRLERIARGPGGGLWLDVAHNPEGIAAVVAAVRSGVVPRPSVVVFGCHPDKDRAGMWAVLRTLGCPLWWVPCERAAPGQAPAPAPPSDRRFEAIDEPALWPAVRAELDRGGTALACGSHRVVGAMRAAALELPVRPEPQDPRPAAS